MLELLAFAAALSPIKTDDFDPRPSCVDWVAVGRLKMLRQIDYTPGRTDTAVASYAMATYRVRMTITRGIWGTHGARSAEFDYRTVAGAYPRPAWGPFVIFRGRDADGAMQHVGMEPIERGAKDEPYIPIVHPFHSERVMEADWRQVGWEAYLHPVTLSYAREKFPYDDREAEPPFTSVRDGRMIVHKGFYLKDLPRMFAAVRPDSCGRF